MKEFLPRPPRPQSVYRDQLSVLTRWTEQQHVCSYCPSFTLLFSLGSQDYAASRPCCKLLLTLLRALEFPSLLYTFLISAVLISFQSAAWFAYLLFLLIMLFPCTGHWAPWGRAIPCLLVMQAGHWAWSSVHRKLPVDTCAPGRSIQWGPKGQLQPWSGCIWDYMT